MKVRRETQEEMRNVEVHFALTSLSFVFFPLSLSRALCITHTKTRAHTHTHTSKEKADQIFICLSGLKLWLGPFTAAGSLLMMRGSCSPRERGNTNKKTDRLIDTNEQPHTHHTCKYTRTHTYTRRIQAVFANTP